MKKIISLFIIAGFLCQFPVLAIESGEVSAPVWEDYVPKKYQNPRTDFTRGKSIAELVVGIVLTDLLITAPVGIPMICHSTTKLKNISYAEKKEIFFNGLKEAETLQTPEEKQIYYDKLLKRCKFKEKK